MKSAYKHFEKSIPTFDSYIITQFRFSIPMFTFLQV